MRQRHGDVADASACGAVSAETLSSAIPAAPTVLV
jgi:hypothetical protein